MAPEYAEFQATVEDLEEFPYVQQSTLNFGIPDIAGRTASSIDVLEMERVSGGRSGISSPAFSRTPSRSRSLRNLVR